MVKLTEEKLNRFIQEVISETLEQSNNYIEEIPTDCGNFTTVFGGSVPYKNFEYFGDCVNSVNIFGDATTMAQFVNSCQIVNPSEVINKISSGDRKLPKELITNLNKINKSNETQNPQTIVCGLSTYQKIMWIYLSATDKHYFFDCM